MKSLSFRKLDNGGYITTEPVAFETGLRGYVVHASDSVFFDLSMDGVLTVHPGFYWDGASGPALDTDSIMQAALVHDAFYWMIEHGFIPRAARESADIEFFWLIRLYAEKTFASSSKSVFARALLWLRLARSYWCFAAVRLMGGLWLKNQKGKPARVMKKIALMFVLLAVVGCSAFPGQVTDRPKMNDAELACVAANEVKFSPRLVACKTEACIDQVTKEHDAADVACIDGN